MKILIAPDSFKESLDAVEAAEAMARGARRALPRASVDLCPMADGGEGTVQALVAATGGHERRDRVTGPLGEQVEATWGMLGPASEEEGKKRGGVVEMAEAAGLHLVPPDLRDTARATTYGVGELIRRALEAGARRIIIGIGGSATTDGGTGMAQALGVRFEGIEGLMTGGKLGDVTAVDMSGRDPRLEEVEVVAACDVTNPLIGEEGAVRVYGPQKGAGPERIEQIERGMAHLAGLIPQVDPRTPGAGAAGGLGFGLMAFCGARLARGVELVLDAARFDQRLAGADLVLTGEGKLDGQSIRGKTCIGVARAAAARGVPTVALVGTAGEGAEKTLEHGLSTYHALTDRVADPDRAVREAAPLLEDLAAEVVGEVARRR